MRLDRDWIAGRIPHAGAMCLLDEVLDWDAERIRCRTRQHRTAGNPLRAHGRLAAVCGVEFAAQAMAVHGALLAQGASGRPAGGYLASVRNVRIRALRLDDLAGDLVASAVRVGGDGAMVLYEFALADGERVLVDGRATVVLDAGALAAASRGRGA
jgi:predicted hotdog family 3-hydroxylacyl-ACP dehydratase